ncbi:MAG: polysaccharide deacetylase family protein [Alcanivoracaceae bacterium]|nr:polysaccharide deacetylase family protein [Alcanivoracaceae bacterium]
MVRTLVKTVMLSLLLVQPAPAAVILMYHHIDAGAPAATSVTPEQFNEHLDRLSAEGFEVVRLDDLIEQVRAGADPRRKLVAITFDDAYRSIYEVGLPALEARGWQGAVFINTGGVGDGPMAMTQEMVTDMHRRGHLLLNHSHSHPHMVRRLDRETELDWRQRIRGEIEQAQQKLAEWTGADVLPWLAWPYGEQTRDLRGLSRDMGYLGFGQQSGALDASIDWQNIPRIPVNRQYAGWSSLREKLLALPFPLRATLPEDGVTRLARPELTLVLNGDWRGRQLQCFIGGKLMQPTVRFSDGVSEVTLRAATDIPIGRSRYNCTAFAGDGRYYWHSWVWMRRTDSGWYPE